MNLYSQHFTFVKSLSLIECYWQYRGSNANKKDLSYAAALRQLATEKLKTPVPEINKNSACELCGEVVSKKKGFVNRRFGILENCDHVFCLFCIKTYRKVATAQTLPKQDGRQTCADDPQPQPVACPVCGSESSFVAASLYHPAGPDSRAAFVMKFREEVQSVTCPWFRSGLGQCMFPDKCVLTHDVRKYDPAIDVMLTSTYGAVI